jgi:hypothetical protein
MLDWKTVYSMFTEIQSGVSDWRIITYLAHR